MSTYSTYEIDQIITLAEMAEEVALSAGYDPEFNEVRLTADERSVCFCAWDDMVELGFELMPESL